MFFSWPKRIDVQRHEWTQLKIPGMQRNASYDLCWVLLFKPYAQILDESKHRIETKFFKIYSFAVFSCPVTRTIRDHSRYAPSSLPPTYTFVRNRYTSRVPWSTYLHLVEAVRCSWRCSPRLLWPASEWPHWSERHFLRNILAFLSFFFPRVLANLVPQKIYDVCVLTSAAVIITILVKHFLLTLQ